MMKLINVNELSDILNIKVKTIYDWTHRGLIPHVKLGGLLRFNPDAISKWVKSNTRTTTGRGSHVYRA